MLKDMLNYTAREVSEHVEYLNHGGCCVLASVMSEELLARGILTLGVAFDEDRLSLDVSESFNHVAILVPVDGVWMQWDSDGCQPPTDSWHNWADRLPGYLTPFRLSELAANPNNWNRRFDRDQIPFMRHLVRRGLGARKNWRNNPILAASNLPLPEYP